MHNEEYPEAFLTLTYFAEVDDKMQVAIFQSFKTAISDLPKIYRYYLDATIVPDAMVKTLIAHA